jgi:spectinomycin phosphotransferase
VFLPFGNDASAWAYRLQAADGAGYFLKVRQGIRNEAGLVVPRYLRDHGVPSVVAPLPTQSRTLWTGLAGYALILYPFIDGRTGMEFGLSDDQWPEFGTTIRRLHDTALPSNLAAGVKRDTFQPQWSPVVRSLDDHISTRSFADPTQVALATFWQGRRAEIQALVERAEALGELLQAASLPFVLCHADAHTANVLVDADQQIWIVDWDETLLAPKERDLMFIVGATDPRNRTRPREQELFFRGYGPSDVDRLALVYYRYEWAVQEIGDNGERVFQPATGADTKRDALQGFMRSFEPGGDVAQAYQSDGT